MSRRARLLIAAALLLLVVIVALRWVAQPQQVAAIVLNRASAALDLEITARGVSEYRLRGTPMLVLREVEARQPGAATPLLQAKRILVSLPWSTVRARGSELTIRRLELDAPQVDLPSLQRWLDSRPPSVPRLPTFTDGLRVRDGEVVASGWRLTQLQLDVPRLQATQAMQAHVRGQYLAAPLSVPLDLAVALSRPEILVAAGGSGFAAYGHATLRHADGWRIPATLALSGPLRRGESDWRVLPLHLGAAAQYEADDTRLPFALGVHGPAILADDLRLPSAGLVLHGRGAPDTDLIPPLRGQGSLLLGDQLQLQVEGEIARWPQAWPTLPPPLGQSKSPLPVALDYRGTPGFTDPVSLRLARDDAKFDGRLRIAQITAWVDQAATGSPLPPLAGTFSAPRIEISGAVLEGVEVEFQDEASAP